MSGDWRDNGGAPATQYDPTIQSRVVPYYTNDSSAAGYAVRKGAGRVEAILRIGNVVYVGGDIRQIEDTDGSRRSTQWLVAMDATTGAQITTFAPNLDEEVQAIIAGPWANTIIVGGQFTGRIKTLDATTGATIATTYPAMSGGVRALELRGSQLWVGGPSYCKKLTLPASSTGTATNVAGFSPNISGGDVRGISADPGSNKLVIAGWFTSVNGATGRGYITAIDRDTGANATWANNSAFLGAAAAEVISLSPVDDNGYIYGAVGGAGGRAASWNVSTGAGRWFLGTDGNCQAVCLSGTAIVFGMHGDVCATVLNTIIGDAPAGSKVTRHKWFATDKAGTLLPWAIVPTVDSKGGNNGGTATKEDDGSPLGGWSCWASHGVLYLGGDWTKIGGTLQRRFAAYADPGATAPPPPATASWYDFPLAGNVPLPAGQVYLGVHIGGGSDGISLAGDTSGTHREATDSYADGTADPFPTPTTSAAFTGDVYALVDIIETEAAPVVYYDELAVFTGATPTIKAELLVTVPETLTVTASATTVTGLAAEQYVPVAGNYADDLAATATATPSLPVEAFEGGGTLEVTATATLVAFDAVGLVEGPLPLTTQARPTLAADDYLPLYSDTLVAAATTGGSLPTETYGVLSPVDVQPDLEAVVPCYTPGVDIALYPEDAVLPLYPRGWEVNF